MAPCARPNNRGIGRVTANFLLNLIPTTDREIEGNSQFFAFSAGC